MEVEIAGLPEVLVAPLGFFEAPDEFGQLRVSEFEEVVLEDEFLNLDPGEERCVEVLRLEELEEPREHGEVEFFPEAGEDLVEELLQEFLREGRPLLLLLD